MSDVIQIINTVFDANNKLKFELNFDGLKEWVEPIKDKEVAVIPVVGPTQTGRSLILNLIGHKLSNRKWEEQITGFESRADVDRITSGLWLSKPIIIKRDDGKELAVLLLDTQSVFDGNTSVEDSSRIFWICLLVSSCLIINLFTSNMTEDFLQKLEPFLQYMRSNSGCARSLVFLMRDWNKTNLFKHGRKGGNQYLSNRLEIKGNSKALNTKRWLKDCFKQMDCYLFSGLGLDEDEEEFNGFTDKLSDNFKNCLQEFFMESLNANKLIPKEINNKFITGSELCLFFKVYVELFNCEEQPNHLAITTATTETLDLILIDELKVQHSTQLKARVLSISGFVSRQNLSDYFNKLSHELKSVFETRKKSNYPDIIEKLNQALDAEFQQNFNYCREENERKRQKFCKHGVNVFEIKYKSFLLNDFRNNRFFLCSDLTKNFEKHRTVVFREFNNLLNGEEEDLFEEDFKNLERSLLRLNNEFTEENNRRMAEAEEKNTCAVNESTGLYQALMGKLIETYSSLNDEGFLEQEKLIKTEARQAFLNECSFGDSKFIKKFDINFRERISRLKNDFKEQLRRKNEKTIVDIEIDLIDTSEELNRLSLDAESKDQFKQAALKVKDKFFDALRYNGVSHELFVDFTKELDTRIDELLNGFNKTSNKKEKYDDSKLLTLAKGVYTEVCRSSTIVDIEIDLIDTIEELNRLSLVSDSKDQFKQAALKVKDKFFDALRVKGLRFNWSHELFKNFTKELDTKIDELLNGFNKTLVNKEESWRKSWKLFIDGQLH